MTHKLVVNTGKIIYQIKHINYLTKPNFYLCWDTCRPTVGYTGCHTNDLRSRYRLNDVDEWFYFYLEPPLTNIVITYCERTQFFELKQCLSPYCLEVFNCWRIFVSGKWVVKPLFEPPGSIDTESVKPAGRAFVVFSRCFPINLT